MAYGDSAAASLAAVQSAIAACLANKTYRIGDRLFTKANLKELRALEKEWQAAVNKASNSRPGISRADMSGYMS